MNTSYQSCLSQAGKHTRMTPGALMATGIVLFTFMSIAEADVAADGQAIVKVGKTCPVGYRLSGEYCTPGSGDQHTPAAIEKKGICPAGYRNNGSYCVGQTGRQDIPQAVAKKGPCPAGYRTSGAYCVEQGK